MRERGPTGHSRKSTPAPPPASSRRPFDWIARNLQTTICERLATLERCPPQRRLRPQKSSGRNRPIFAATLKAPRADGEPGPTRNFRLTALAVAPPPICRRRGTKLAQRVAPRARSPILEIRLRRPSHEPAGAQSTIGSAAFSPAFMRSRTSRTSMPMTVPSASKSSITPGATSLVPDGRSVNGDAKTIPVAD
jgi:hypothetical protein